MEYKIINGEKVPVIKAKAKEIIRHKRTNKIYASKEEFDKEVNDPNIDTTIEDFTQNVEVIVDSLQVFGKKG